MLKKGLIVAATLLAVGCSYDKDKPSNLLGQAVASVSEARSWTYMRSGDVVFITLQGRIFLCQSDSVQVELGDGNALDGTYASFLDVEWEKQGYPHRAGKTVLYVRGQENKKAWDEYIQNKVEERRRATSPRDVLPPEPK